MSTMRTSVAGRAFLERHEGVVLRAYRDVTGVMTIGAGLTAASGVVTPKPGMVISREEANRLLDRALARNYEPAVRAALRRPGREFIAQHEFDGAVSFHFNTGAIARASWVEAWRVGNRDGVRAGLLKWVKGGGSVLPALQRRRSEEARLILDADYGPSGSPTRRQSGYAVVALNLTPAEIDSVRAGFRALGYEPGSVGGRVLESAVRAFQGDHDLTVDGILGRATLATLQRRRDARTKARRTAVAGGGGAIATQLPAPGDQAMVTAALLVGVALAALFLAWRYRDVVAAKVQRLAPKLATWLRSL